MREVLPGRLWIGNSRDARNLRLLHETGLRAIVDLAAEEPAAQLSRDLIYCRFPLLDGEGNSPELLNLASLSARGLIQAGIPTLVACSAGASRSPSLAAMALAQLQNRHPNEVLSDLCAEQSHDVSPQLWEDLLHSCQARNQ
ncbi:MAG: dual specificity protein phosphatase family protein [Planctomycetaceae bacterium]|nr:dual specificity protein phosphatase family protein [Planctomycetaceae bacterium]